MIRCEFVDPLAEPRWNQWILEVPGATFFHSSQWARVLSQSYNYPLHYVVMRDAAGSICGVLPVAEINSWLTGRRGVCLPFSDECAPLATIPEVLDSAVQTVSAMGRKHRWDYLELRGSAENLNGAIESDRFLGHRIPMDLHRLNALQKITVAIVVLVVAAGIGFATFGAWVYAASEAPLPGVTSEALGNAIREAGHKNVHYFHSIQEGIAFLLKQTRPGDAILTIGAGSISRASNELMVLLGTEHPTHHAH